MSENPTTPVSPEAPGAEGSSRSSGDMDAVAAWMDDRGLGAGPVTHVAELSGGTQNEMFTFTRGHHRYVLRRPPRHRRAFSNRALIREMRVLAALAGTQVTVPPLIAACEDPAVLDGPVFYLMEVVEGFNCMHELPALHAGSPRVRHQMGLEAAHAAAKLSQVDYVAVGLSELGNPVGFLDRQVPRWLAELDGYSALEGYHGPDLPGLDRVAEWLEANRPTRWRPGLMHGDFHLGNLMFRHHDAGIAAIVDWEMATVGDPLLDLGWLLATWPTADPPSEYATNSAIGRAGGLPTRAEIIEIYAAESGRDTSAATWYQALACFKLGILLEGTHARASAGKASRAVGDRLHRRARFLVGQADALR